jgi:hypothetical protein
LLYELFVLSFFLDSTILRFLFRATAQTQFARPKDLGKSLRFMFLYCCVVNLWPVIRHAVPWGQVDVKSQGLLIDFLGRCEPLFMIGRYT